MVNGRPSNDPPFSPPVPTLGTVSGRGFLAIGAAVGALGWGATALLTASPRLAAPFDPALVAAAVWTPLVGLMITVGLFWTPDPVRFARPFLVWGPANGLATLATAAALLGWLPEATYWLSWALAGAAGYLWTGLAVRRAGGDGRLWLAAACCEASVLVAGVTVGGPWPFVLLGTVHALPLALDISAVAERVGLPVWSAPVAVTAGLLTLALATVR